MANRLLLLKCNHMESPLGVDDLPHFSYRLTSDDPTVRQTAYRITVASADKTVWDSGFVSSDEQILIPYAGEALAPTTRYTWQVSVRTSDGGETTSASAYFETGMMRSFGWNAKWITAGNRAIYLGNRRNPKKDLPAPYFRRVFDVQKEVRDATLYICGLGYYECYVNGISLKDTYLDPAFTEYDKAVLYKAHKVTGLKQGKNALGVLLGNGFFNANTDDVWNFYNATWRSHPTFLSILRIEYTDGSVEELPSDASFVTSAGPILRSDVRTSESYDAQAELGDWTSPDYDDSTWVSAVITKAPGGALSGSYTTPIRKTDSFSPTEIRKLSDKIWIFDAGKNTVGWATLRMTAPAGTKITLRYLERFDENLKETQNLASCLHWSEEENFQTDHYVAAGRGVEEWHPLFKYNGYRYVIVSCESGIPADLTLTIEEIRTDLATAGEFDCSDERINRLQTIAIRSALCNFHHMPTDCPHREKNGWTGDAQLSSEYLLYNFDGAAAYDRWIDDIIRAQRPTGQLPGIVPSTGWGYNWGSGPAWDSVCAIIPWMMYLYCGDKRVLARIYPTVKRYIAFCDTMANDNICDFGLSDWCYPKSETHKKCRAAITDTGYFYYDTLLASKMARVLELPEESALYAQKAADIRASFRRRFLQGEGDAVALKDWPPSQAAYASILYFGLYEEEEKEALLTALKQEIHEQDGHLDVGILGLKYVTDVLTDAEEIDLLLQGLSRPDYPSIGYMMENGATTLWEDYEGKQSQNHHMFGVYSATFYKALAGIRADENAPAFRHTFFRQNISGLQFSLQNRFPQHAICFF